MAKSGIPKNQTVAGAQPPAAGGPACEEWSLSRMLKHANAVAIPPNQPGQVYLVTDGEVPILRIVEQMGPKTRSVWHVELSAAKAAFLDGQYIPDSTAIRDVFKGKGMTCVVGNVYVKASAGVLFAVEYGVTAQQSVEDDYGSRGCDPCCNK